MRSKYVSIERRSEIFNYPNPKMSSVTLSSTCAQYSSLILVITQLSILAMNIAAYHLHWQKRVFDLVLSIFLLISLFPLFVFVSIAVALSSGLPIFFTQNRTGFQKKTFKIIKFRTMRNDAQETKKSLVKKNEAPWPMFKMDHDPRFTTIGRFLSHTGIDELPQLVNVLMGKMSITGPRPLPIEEARKLPSSWNFRYKTRPGIVSHWALSKDRYKSLEDWRKLEKKELINGSLKADIQLILRSVFFILKSNMRFFIRK